MKAIYIPLNKVETGQTCIVQDLRATGAQRRRMLDLGFIKDTEVKVMRCSPLGDPTAYFVRNTVIALRKEEASKILVKVNH
ncbi:FeoA family protein [Defluviitalea raffinosedens]|uniref:FeoA family protein n=1 Tax=Defluviitalea raffinosedens TaxID=1450156 RepID=UPI00195756B2|nr:FeoA family protein [Defluviitalea raffinosedens]MBM7684707.1 ferrous iron transport protein A [Defluviitalea raffinosedens]